MKNQIRKAIHFGKFWFRLIRGEYRLSKTPSTTPQGFKFVGHPAMEAGEFEPGETEIFSALMSQVDYVINVGANVGYYCCIALEHKKKVIAFEPMAENIRGLLKNIKLNAWEDEIEVFPIALSDTTGILEMFGGGTGASFVKGWAGASQSVSALVPVSTLDTVLKGRFYNKNCLFMIDIEGVEKAMLDGAKSFLDSDNKSIWFVEISVRANQPDGVRINPDLLDTFEIFWSRGYQAWTTHNSHRLITEEEVKNIIAGGKDTIFGDTVLFLDRNVHKDLDIPITM